MRTVIFTLRRGRGKGGGAVTSTFIAYAYIMMGNAIPSHYHQSTLHDIVF